jgi:hypothetical protein
MTENQQLINFRQMKTIFSTLTVCSIMLLGAGCSNNNILLEEDKTYSTGTEKTINACGVTDPAKNLPWLVELIEKAKTDKTGNYFGEIWLEKFKEQDVFVTNMMLGSGGIMYYFFDCNGNHFHRGTAICTACNFVGNNHFFIENEDFGTFIQNMKLDVVIYSPF